jgi:hypothetical protein
MFVFLALQDLHRRMLAWTSLALLPHSPAASQAWHSSFARDASGRAAPVSSRHLHSCAQSHHFCQYRVGVQSPAFHADVWRPPAAHFVRHLPVAGRLTFDLASAARRLRSAQTKRTPPGRTTKADPAGSCPPASSLRSSASPCSTAGHMAGVADAPGPSGRISLLTRSCHKCKDGSTPQDFRRQQRQPPAGSPRSILT